MEQRGIIEEYMNRVYKIVVVLLVASCSIAGVIYGVMKAIGLYPELDWMMLLVYLAICAVYAVFAVVIFRKDALLKDKMRYSKIFMIVVLIIQANILYLFFQEEPYGVFSFIFLFLVDCLLISNFS